jgi:GAF domain-containing protein
MDEVEKRYPGLLPTFKAGLRSILVVPLISKDEVIGVFHLRSLKPNAYTESDLKLAEKVGNEIAGAIANAQLYIERKRAEEAAARLAQENAVMAEIGRVISSTLNIDEVYERFAEEVGKLIPIDRISLSSNNPDGRSATMTYVWGPEIKNRKRGDVFPLKGTIVEKVMARRSGVFTLMENEEALAQIYPTLLSTFQAGFRSIISAPLVSEDQAIGALNFHSFKEKAFTDLDVKLAERVGNQIAGAIANAQLFTERKHAEEAAARLAQENAVMAEIGRVISSTLNIEEVYERFAEEVRKLISFDRIGIQTVNTKDNTTTLNYISGVDVEKRHPGDIISVDTHGHSPWHFSKQFKLRLT